MSILVMAFKVLLVVIMVGIDHFIDCQEVEEKLIISKRRLISEHDQRTDNVYAEILSKLFKIILLITLLLAIHY